MAHPSTRIPDLAKSGDRIALIIDYDPWVWVGEEQLWYQLEGALEGYVLDAEEMTEHLAEQVGLGRECRHATARSGRITG